MIRNTADAGALSFEKRERKPLPVEILGLTYFLAVALAGFLLVWQPATVARLQDQKQHLETTLQDLKMRTEDLRKTVSTMESLDFVEREARDRLGMMEPRLVKTVTLDEPKIQGEILASHEITEERGIFSLLSRIAQVFETKEATAKGER